MSALDRRMSPATVAPTPGREREKLLQRFAELDAASRDRLLGHALGLIRQQELAKLTPHEREVERLIWSVDRALEIQNDPAERNAIRTRVNDALLQDYIARLAALGVDYFGTGAATRRAA